MKTLQMLIMLSFSIFLSNCSNDDDFKLDADSLKQTSWEGIMIESYNGGEKLSKSDVGIIFYTAKDGQYDLKHQGDIEPERERFTYTIDNKILYINENISLKGYWLLIEKGKNKMVLEQSTGGEYSYKASLTLSKKH